MKVTLCATCDGYSAGFLHALRQAVASAGLPVKVATAACMQGCTRPVALAVRDEGKTAYLFGEQGVVTVAITAGIAAFLLIFGWNSGPETTEISDKI